MQNISTFVHVFVCSCVCAAASLSRLLDSPVLLHVRQGGCHHHHRLRIDFPLSLPHLVLCCCVLFSCSSSSSPFFSLSLWVVYSTYPCPPRHLLTHARSPWGVHIPRCGPSSWQATHTSVEIEKGSRSGGKRQQWHRCLAGSKRRRTSSLIHRDLQLILLTSHLSSPPHPKQPRAMFSFSGTAT